MAAGLPRKNLPLPRVSNIQDAPTAWHLNQLNYAIQSAGQNTAAALTQLGITQVQYGTLTFSGPSSVSVTFNAPFVDAGYVLMLSPAIIPSGIAKTSTGFTVTLDSIAPGYPIDWVAIR